MKFTVGRALAAKTIADELGTVTKAFYEKSGFAPNVQYRNAVILLGSGDVIYVRNPNGASEDEFTSRFPGAVPVSAENLISVEV